MSCLFCEIVAKQKPAYFITKNDKFCSFLDIFPIEYGHCLLVTNTHYSNFVKCPTKIINQATPILKKIVNLQKEKLNAKGFHITTNINKIGNQEIIHLHWHIIPRYKMVDRKRGLQQRLTLTPEEFSSLQKKLLL